MLLPWQLRPSRWPGAPSAAGSRHRDIRRTATVERVLQVARGDARAADAGGGRRVLRTSGRLRIEDG